MTVKAADALALPGRLRAHLEETRLIASGDSVSVALSGGLDSTVLLHLLRFPLADLGLDVRAIHLDHGMRPHSHEDALWVRGLCRAWGVPLIGDRADPAPGSEAAARRVRYEFLERQTPPDSLILTGHHLDDQAETVLFRIARGTGLRGLSGILPRRGRVVRPLLPFSRSSLRAYAGAVGLRWRTDPTNQDPRYARNRLRHRVLPELERARPGAAARLAGLAGEARKAEAALEEAVSVVAGEVILEQRGPVLKVARPLLLSYHPHLRARLLRHLLRRYGTPPGRAGTRAALEFISSGRSGGEIHLPGGVRLERDFDRITVVPAAHGGPGSGPDEALWIHRAGPGRGRARVGGKEWYVRWRIVSDAVSERSTGPSERRMTVRGPALPLQLRGREPGDRIQLTYGSKKLKKLMSEYRLDRRERRQVPVLVDARGDVLWAVGLARAANVGGSGDALEIVVTDAREH